MGEDGVIEEVRSRDRGSGLLVWPGLLLLVYALSVGPVAKWCPNPPEALRVMYSPLAYLYLHVPPVKAFYDWYAKLWGTTL